MRGNYARVNAAMACLCIAGCAAPAPKPMLYRTVVADYCGPGLQRPDVTRDWPVGLYYRPGDCNCDGRVDFGDIDAFVAALSAPVSAYWAMYPDCRRFNADCNDDCRVDFDDIDPFVCLLLQGD